LFTCLPFSDAGANQLLTLRVKKWLTRVSGPGALGTFIGEKFAVGQEAVRKLQLTSGMVNPVSRNE